MSDIQKVRVNYPNLDLATRDISRIVNQLIDSVPVPDYSSQSYIRIPDRPGGLMIQWQEESLGSGQGPHSITFPEPFESGAIGCLLTPSRASLAGIEATADFSTLTKTGIDLYKNDTSSRSYFVVSFGY